MQRRKAIIDIGTNTFNLLLVEFTDNGSFDIIYEEKLPVKLGKGSMTDGILKPEAIKRAIEALKKHIQTCKEHKTEEISAFATSAVRSAKNKNEFRDIILKECNLDIEVISGDREAELIYYGVRHAVPLKKDEVYLILDIGGGSNEFIICNHNQIIWKKSYNLGIARLLEIINPQDPITQSDIDLLKQKTDELISDLIDACKKFNPRILLGASGSFETYASMIVHEYHGSDIILKSISHLEIFREDFDNLYQKLIKSDREGRKNMPGLPLWRIDMIVLAAVFTKYIMDLFQLEKIIFSDYALKEGVVLQ